MEDFTVEDFPSDVLAMDRQLLSGNTMLQIACAQGNLELAKRLLDNNASVNKADRKGNSPLFYALQNGHIEMAEFLISRKANLKQKNLDGFCPAQHQQ